MVDLNYRVRYLENGSFKPLFCEMITLEYSKLEKKEMMA